MLSKPGAIPPAEEPRPASGGAGPSIYAVLQDQAGPKLEPRKGQVELLVIDRAELPKAN